MIDQKTADAAIDSGQLWIAMHNGRWWKARRNGKTQTWKTRPADYSIPFKVGLKTCGRFDRNWLPDNYMISETDPNNSK